MVRPEAGPYSQPASSGLVAGLKASNCGPDPRGTGAVGFNKSPQMRRPGNQIRRTNDRSRRPSARPGVTPALRRWGTVSLPF